jgi:hypothetical protein
MLDTIGSAVRQSARAEYDKVAAILLVQVQATATQVSAKLAEAVAEVVAKADEVSSGLRRVALQPVKLDDRWITAVEQRVGGYSERFLTKLLPPPSLMTARIAIEKVDTPGQVDPSAHQGDRALQDKKDESVVVIDGSNVCSSPGRGPDMARLRDAIEAAANKWPERTIITVVDRSMSRHLEGKGEHAQAADLQEMIASSVVIEPPPGHPGRADTFLLMIASENNGLVLSNDSYKEFQHQFPWLSDEDRLYGYTFHPTLGWKFTPRFAVKFRA